MVYILVEMHLALHVPFETLAMVYILVQMHLTPHVLFGTLDMAYILIKMHLALAIIINILFKMHLAHNNILNVSFIRQTKIHYAFQITKNSFHCNPMWLPRIIHKLVTPTTCAISSFVHTIAYMKLPITFWNGITHIISKFASFCKPIPFKSLQLVIKGVHINLLPAIPNCFNRLPIYSCWFK